MTGVYCIRNRSDGKLYVGSTVSFEKRWAAHKRRLRAGRHINKHLQAAWDKYGGAAFSFEVLEIVGDGNLLLEREQYWIDQHMASSRERGYNHAPAAGGMLGFRHSQETKNKIRLVGFRNGSVPWNKGRKMGDEYTQSRIRTVQSDGYRKSRRTKFDGFRHTDEAKRKIGAASSGRVISSDTRLKMRNAMLGRKLGEEHRLNCIKAWKLRRLSKQTKEEITCAL